MPRVRARLMCNRKLLSRSARGMDQREEGQDPSLSRPCSSQVMEGRREEKRAHIACGCAGPSSLEREVAREK